jgi:hypothetical protein
MSSCYYLVHISTTASELPQAVTDFLHEQSCFHHLAAHDFIFAAATGQTSEIREKLHSLLGSAGTAEVCAATFHSRP